MSIARQTLSPTTTTAAGAGLGGFRPGSGTLLAVLLCLVVAAPLLALLGFIGQPTQGMWAHLASTVLAEYARNSALLCAGVGAGTLAVGAGAAWLVTMYRWPCRPTSWPTPTPTSCR
jgi:iron(III) transport system permease protein